MNTPTTDRVCTSHGLVARAIRAVPLAGAVAAAIGVVSLAPTNASAALDQKALSLTLFSPTVDQRRLDFTLDNAAAMGVTHVSINNWWFQDNINSTSITPRFNLYSATDDTIRQVIDAAHARGMAVQLRPIVDLASDPTHWRGQIVGGNSWFNSTGGYGDYIRHMADIAQEKNVAMFSMGVELEALQNQEANWRSLVSSVRSRYSGQLVYAANWGNPAIGNTVQWWDALDYVGIDAYYPLTGVTNPTPAQLNSAWLARANQIETWRNSTVPGKQILFTECGYQAMDGTNISPPGVSSTVDMREQADCYSALLNANAPRSWFSGGYWWSWDPNNTRPTAGDFQNLGKPAYDVMGSSYIPGYTVGGAWTGAGGNVFQAGNSWSDGTMPSDLRAVTFNGAGGGNTTVSLSTLTAPVARVTFDTASAAAYTFTSGTMAFRNGGGITITNTVTTTQTFNNVIAISGQALFVNWSTAANQKLIVNGSISSTFAGQSRLAIMGNGNTTLAGPIVNGSGTLSLFKGGDGTLTLSGVNTFHGETFVSDGNLTVTSNAALGSGAGGTVVANGASLQIAPGLTINNEPITISGYGVGGQGALQLLDQGPYIGATLGGPVTIDANGLSEIHNRGFNQVSNPINVLTLAGKITGGSAGATLRLRSGNSSPGHFLLSHPDNDYVGLTQIAGGMVTLAGGDDTLPVTTVVELDTYGRSQTIDAGVLNLNGSNQSIAGLRHVSQATMPRVVNRAASTTRTLTLNVGAGIAYSFSGTILGGTGDLAVAKTGDGQQTLSAANTYTGGTSVSNGTLMLSHPSAAGTGPMSVTGGIAVFIAGLPTAPRAAALSIIGTGALDLNDNDLVVDPPTPRAAVEAMIVSARNGGDWTGPGLTSSVARTQAQHATTLGTLSGSEYFSLYGLGAPFSGQAIVGGSTLVKYTWYGDADFSGVIDFDDYVRIDAGFNAESTGWLNGDFDYSSLIDFDDYVLIDLAYNAQTGTLRRVVDFLSGEDRSLSGMTTTAQQKAVEHFSRFGTNYAAHFLSAVPEPSGLLLLGLLPRRRKRV